MEFEPIVRIYESKLLRRSPLVTALTQISFEQEYEMISQAAKLKGNEILLDLACGTGIYSRRLAGQLAHGMVLGIDLSTPMLNYAKPRVRKEGLENILFIHSDAIDLPFSDETFEAVNCCGALHLFTDLNRALSEVSRVLKVGGRFTLATFRKRAGPLAERIVRLRKDATGMSAFRPDELELRLNHTGFAKVKCHHARGIWLVMSAIKQ
jgi:ubiquinone/menaquinone biosynthesis C-methylase UbiE